MGIILLAKGWKCLVIAKVNKSYESYNQNTKKEDYWLSNKDLINNINDNFLFIPNNNNNDILPNLNNNFRNKISEDCIKQLSGRLNLIKEHKR